MIRFFSKVLFYLSTAIIFALPINAFAANSCIDECNRSLSVTWCNSFAWNQQYLFIAEGYDKGEEYRYIWGTPHYRISRVDRITGSRTTLIEDYPYHAIILMTEGNNLYILRKYYSSNIDLLNYLKRTDAQGILPEIERNETEGTFHLIKMDFDGTVVDKTRFDIGEPILDELLFNQKLYIASSNRVICIDLQSKESTDLYRAEIGIYNSKSSNHMIIENDILYLQDGHMIVAVDIHTGISHIVCKLDTLIEWRYVYYQHKYLILDRCLYFWDNSSRKMVALNLESGIRKCISKDLYLFIQASKDGVAVIRIREPYLEDLYATINCENPTFPAIDTTVPTVQKEYLFFRFEDSNHPEFNPDTNQYITFESDMREAVYIDNQQYINDDLEINSLNAPQIQGHLSD